MSTDRSIGLSAPKNGARQPTQKKMRSSCDACSASKIKCDQERPSCLRCRNMDVKCNYSASRRMGKPPAPRDANGMKGTKPKTSPAKIDSEVLHISRQQLGSDAFPPQNNSVSLDLEAYFIESEALIPMQWQVSSFYSPDSSTHKSGEVAMAPVNLFDNDLEIFGETESNLFMPTLPEDTFAFDNICMDSFILSNANGPFTPLGGLMEQTSKTKPKPLFLAHDCTSLASSTIQLLHLDSSNCGAATTPHGNPFQPSSSIDQVLINNKSAIENVHILLACPCSMNPQYALTIALIVHNILLCYEAIIQATSNSHAEPKNSFWFEILRSTPITVGAYKIDAEDEQRIRIQVVVNELRKVRALVEKYAERYCSNKDDKAGNESIYSALENFLQAKLKQAVADMISTCRP